MFSEINLVLAKFIDPFLQLFRQTASLLLSKPGPNHALVAQAMVLLLELYYDFTCQDLPPAIEDTQPEFFAPRNGWFHVFLAWDPEELRGDVSQTKFFSW